MTDTGDPQERQARHGDDFASTEPQAREDLDPRWWCEAADGRCSDEAAHFAASLPAPLSVV